MLTARARLTSLASSRCLATSAVDLPALRLAKAGDLEALVEQQQRLAFRAQLASGGASLPAPALPSAASLEAVGGDNFMRVVRGGMATFLMHAEARVASALGQGFYTIGPCGEELLGSIALGLRQDDAVALHYRHLATQVVRQLDGDRSMEDIFLDRYGTPFILPLPRLNRPVCLCGLCLGCRRGMPCASLCQAVPCGVSDAASSIYPEIAWLAACPVAAVGASVVAAERLRWRMQWLLQ